MVCSVDAQCTFDTTKIFKTQLDFSLCSNWADATCDWTGPRPRKLDKKEKTLKLPRLVRGTRLRSPSTILRLKSPFRVKTPRITVRIKTPGPKKRPRRRDCRNCCSKHNSSSGNCNRLLKYPSINPNNNLNSGYNRAPVKCNVVSFQWHEAKLCVTENVIY